MLRESHTREDLIGYLYSKYLFTHIFQGENWVDILTLPIVLVGT
jgi:hypothetical protein